MASLGSFVTPLRPRHKLPWLGRIFSHFRVIKSFNCKNQCNKRRYEYLIPTYAFSPKGKPSQKCFKYKMDQDTLALVRKILGKFVGTKNYHNYTSKVRPPRRARPTFVPERRCSWLTLLFGFAPPLPRRPHQTNRTRATV